MDEVMIRDRQPSDVQPCVDLLADVHRLDGYPLNWPADPHRWLCPPDMLHAWIATTDSAAVVGHVAVHAAPGPSGDHGPARPSAEVGRLFVAPAFRRDHVATRLLQNARRWAADYRTDLTLEVVASQRSAAIALYERTGWQHLHTTTANWTTPDGGPVMLRRYTLHQDPRDGA
ncbi:GNAT family N-acetyltransferase [Dactylosporangium darangshiense]|uniref:GNAT family N-acetyltransferase n=1 Tax=Dactylosporangium darangshiense TaxID=579108 RepID=A0ABP8DU25_9ACTN